MHIPQAGEHIGAAEVEAPIGRWRMTAADMRDGLSFDQHMLIALDLGRGGIDDMTTREE
jgi:hypothetical protein